MYTVKLGCLAGYYPSKAREMSCGGKQQHEQPHFAGEGARMNGRMVSDVGYRDARLVDSYPWDETVKPLLLIDELGSKA